MNKLDMIKAFADLDGVEVYDLGNEYCYTYGTDAYGEELGYDPITDQCLTFQAAIDYSVNLNHESKEVWICDENAGEYDTGYLSSVRFKDGEIPSAIIECILKSRGLYK